MSRFRMTADRPTTWWKLPSYELKPALVSDEEGVRQEGWEIDSGQPAAPVRYRLPDPLLPVILDVDVDSNEAILRFVQSYGPLGVTNAAIEAGDMADDNATRLEDFDGMNIQQRILGYGHFVHVADQQGAIATLGRAQAIAAELANDTFNVRALFGLSDPWIWEKPPANKKAAEHQLHWIINTGLSGFALRMKKRVLTLEPPLSLFAIACLELVDALSKGLPWRRCARDNCDELFLPNRHDQVFHDIRCAHASASRAYRLRQRGEKERG